MCFIISTFEYLSVPWVYTLSTTAHHTHYDDNTFSVIWHQLTKNGAISSSSLAALWLPNRLSFQWEGTPTWEKVDLSSSEWQGTLAERLQYKMILKFKKKSVISGTQNNTVLPRLHPCQQVWYKNKTFKLTSVMLRCLC